MESYHYCCRGNPYPNSRYIVLFVIVLVGSSDALGGLHGSRRIEEERKPRRVLHEPLFPIVQPAVPVPAPAPLSNKGGGIEPPPVTNQPFFPLVPSLSPPSPPDPSSSSGSTSIPADPNGRQSGNVSSSGSGSKSKRSKNIVIAFVVTLSAIAALGVLLFYLHRKRGKDPWATSNIYLDETPLREPNGAGNLRFFQSPSPVTTKLAVNGSGSDVFYLGTMEPFANGRSSKPERDRDTHVHSIRDSNTPIPTHKMEDGNIPSYTHKDKQNENENRFADDKDDDSEEDKKTALNSKFRMSNGADVDVVERFHRRSPEIHPLPPLARRPPRSGVCSDSSDEESFYSPRCPSTTSSRSNNDSPRQSVCKRLFSSSPPLQQQPSIVSLKSESTSTHSYPSSSATSSAASTPSPLETSPPSPPITPTVLPPPIRSHLHSHSPPQHYPRHIPPSPNFETHPPITPPPPTHNQFKTPPPPPPLPPPFFQPTRPLISPSAKQKPDQQSWVRPPAKKKTGSSLSSPSLTKEKSNPLLSPTSRDSRSSPLGHVGEKPNRVLPASPPSSVSPPSSKNSYSPLPPLPTRPPPPFLSSSRSGRQSQLPQPSSKSPPPPPPLPTQNKSSPPESHPPLSSRPVVRPNSALYSSRTGQSLHPIAPTSGHSLSENAAEHQNVAGTDGTPRPKLKPLHWDKVRASPDRAMVWDQLKSGSFKLNEEMFETLFVYNTPTPVKAEGTRGLGSTPPSQNQRILESKKSQNIAILLRALSVTKEEVCDALLEGTSDSLGTELLETLVKMAPSKEEEIRLKEYNGDISKLGPAERFLRALLDIPFAFKRVDGMLYRANFKEEISQIRKSYVTLEAACEEIRSSRLFLKLLEAVLKTGNRMNVGTIRGDAQAFKLDTLLKLVDVKGTDGKTTLLHFVVQEIIKAEGARVASTGEQPVNNSASDIVNDKLHTLGTEVKSQNGNEEDYKKLGLQVVAGLSTEMGNVKKAAGIDSDVLSNSVSKLAIGLGKLREILQIDVTRQTRDGKVDGSSNQGNFYKSMESFLQQAEEDISQIKDEEKRAFSRVKEITEYFHGDAAKEEAHPLRFFVVVRDFLSVLDQVCREIGRIQTKNIQSSVRPPSISVNMFPHPLPRGFYERRLDSSDDESLSP
ncbi:hypothetical protein SUGI_0270920 [Cryptomeria japonica]|uniref:formin-like protein 8 n=1 Tax=Cryptomeria japonica TaxID=3369 RepID=UPI002408B01E|nr:formin-like protein 8 [Cryptomeria japonica]GLJ16200.1 hypothetical protein SUGI_0270920 [Cryptomeria japonica]